MSSTNTNINIRTGINTHADFDLVLLAYLFIYEAILLLKLNRNKLDGNLHYMTTSIIFNYSNTKQ